MLPPAADAGVAILAKAIEAEIATASTASAPTELRILMMLLSCLGRAFVGCGRYLPEESCAGSSALWRTKPATLRPSFTPATGSSRVCWPEKIRLRPASCAATVKLVNERVTPGRAVEVTENDWWSP